MIATATSTTANSTCFLLESFDLDAADSLLKHDTDDLEILEILYQVMHDEQAEPSEANTTTTMASDRAERAKLRRREQRQSEKGKAAGAAYRKNIKINRQKLRQQHIMLERQLRRLAMYGALTATDEATRAMYASYVVESDEVIKLLETVSTGSAKGLLPIPTKTGPKHKKNSSRREREDVVMVVL